MPKYTQFNGEFGFDENPDVVQIWKGPLVHETYDVNDDDDGESYRCNPFVDFECDTTMVEDFNSPNEDIESVAIDIYLLKDNLTLCKDFFNNLKLIFYKIYDTQSDKSKFEMYELLIDTIMKDFIEIDVFINNPILYDGDIDMKVMVNSLSKTGYIPNVIIFHGELQELLNS